MTTLSVWRLEGSPRTLTTLSSRTLTSCIIYQIEYRIPSAACGLRPDGNHSSHAVNIKKCLLDYSDSEHISEAHLVWLAWKEFPDNLKLDDN